MGWNLVDRVFVAAAIRPATTAATTSRILRMALQTRRLPDPFAELNTES